MGLDKRYITKESVIRYLENSGNISSLAREIKIEKIFSAEIRIMDNWSSKFFADLKPIERQIRQDGQYTAMIAQTISSWDKVAIFTSLAETLISLYQKPTHLDVLVTKQLLSIQVPYNESERDIFEWCKVKIIEHFDN